MTNRPFRDEEIDLIVVRAVSAFIAAHVLNGNAAAVKTTFAISLGDETLALAKRFERYLLEGAQ